MSSLTYTNGTLIYRTPYNPGLVAALKSQVPATDRQWDNAARVWCVAPEHAQMLVSITEQYLGERITMPAIPTLSMTETRLLDVRYIGTTKERGTDERSAFGWSDGTWSVILPEPVLRVWFDAPSRPDEETTLYQTLSVKKDADVTTIKTAYRRLARQWHPDVCREPDAATVFRTIHAAYTTLSDPSQRRRYDAGLALAATLGARTLTPAVTDIVNNLTLGYRSPLRCGLLLCEGRNRAGRFVVTEILAWEDIVNEYGQTLSVSWPVGADKFVEVYT